jgi:glutathione S-transferase
MADRYLSGVGVEAAESQNYVRLVLPFRNEMSAALDAKMAQLSRRGLEGANHLFAPCPAEIFAQDAGCGREGGAMRLATRVTVTMPDWAIELVGAIADRTAETATLEHIQFLSPESRPTRGMLPRMSRPDQRPQIVYFDIRGRAEPIRLLLEEADVAYEDVQIGQEEWPKVRPTTPFGRVPIYRDGDLEIPETYAILNYLARKHDLVAKDEPGRVRCDVAVEAFRDYGERLGAVFGALSATSDEGRRSFIMEELPERLSALEALYASNSGESGWWSGESLTIADFAAFYQLEGIGNHFPDALSGFDGLNAFQAKFSSRPRIQAYLISERRPAALFYGPAGKIYPREA